MKKMNVQESFIDLATNSVGLTMTTRQRGSMPLTVDDHMSIKLRHNGIYEVFKQESTAGHQMFDFSDRNGVPLAAMGVHNFGTYIELYHSSLSQVRGIQAKLFDISHHSNMWPKDSSMYPRIHGWQPELEEVVSGDFEINTELKSSSWQHVEEWCRQPYKMILSTRELHGEDVPLLIGALDRYFWKMSLNMARPQMDLTHLEDAQKSAYHDLDARFSTLMGNLGYKIHRTPVPTIGLEKDHLSYQRYKSPNWIKLPDYNDPKQSAEQVVALNGNSMIVASLSLLNDYQFMMQLHNVHKDAVLLNQKKLRGMNYMGGTTSIGEGNFYTTIRYDGSEAMDFNDTKLGNGRPYDSDIMHSDWGHVVSSNPGPFDITISCNIPSLSTEREIFMIMKNIYS